MLGLLTWLGMQISTNELEISSAAHRRMTAETQVNRITGAVLRRILQPLTPVLFQALEMAVMDPAKEMEARTTPHNQVMSRGVVSCATLEQRRTVC